jgi:hypothetical protein
MIYLSVLFRPVACSGLIAYCLSQSLKKTFSPGPGHYTVYSESHCALRLWYVDLVVSVEVAVEVCCCFTVFSC